MEKKKDVKWKKKKNYDVYSGHQRHCHQPPERRLTGPPTARAKRSKRRHFWWIQEARKKEDLGPRIPETETRTNLCSFAKRFMKIGPK